MTFPKISIVTPSFNQGAFLEECINSVLDQQYPALEYIIIDGGSTDNSVEIIKRYKKYLSYWCSKPDKGQSDAINKGFRKASGDLVAWLNSDDFYLSGSFLKVATLYNENPDASFYYGNGYRVSEDGVEQKEFYPGGTVGFDLNLFVLGLNYILQPSTFINREVLNQISLSKKFCLSRENFLDPHLHWGMDTDLWIRLARKIPPLPVNDFLAASREYGETKTAGGSFSRIEELRKIAEKYSGQSYTPGILVSFLNQLHGFVGEHTSPFPYEFRKEIDTLWESTVRIMASIGADSDGLPLQKGNNIAEVNEKKQKYL